MLELIDDSYSELLATGNKSVAEEEENAKDDYRRQTAMIDGGGNGQPPAPTSIVRNVLQLGIIHSANNRQLYLCRTSNSNLTKPLDIIVRLEILGTVFTALFFCVSFEKVCQQNFPPRFVTLKQQKKVYSKLFAFVPGDVIS